MHTISEAGASVEETSIDLPGTTYDELVEAMTILWSGGYVASIAHDLERDAIDVTGDDSDLFSEAFVDRIEEGRQ